MKYKTRDLDGALLDAAVAMCMGDFDPHRPHAELQMLLSDGRRVLAGPQGRGTKDVEWSPSTRWDQGGPIIERERIGFEYCHDDSPPVFYAYIHDITRPVRGINNAYVEVARATGPTHLIAAMRVYVVSMIGDDVELPTLGAAA